jgi:hypothetical protein
VDDPGFGDATTPAALIIIMAFFGPSYFSLFLWKKYDVAHSGPLPVSLVVVVAFLLCDLSQR